MYLKYFFNNLNFLVPANDNEKNVIYIVKLDVDYVSADLMAFKLYAHNKVGWSYPNDS